MRIAGANMYINLALRVWCRALQGLTNQTETEGKKGKSASFYSNTISRKNNGMMSHREILKHMNNSQMLLYVMLQAHSCSFHANTRLAGLVMKVPL